MLGSEGSGGGQRFYFSKWLTFSAAAMLQLSAGLGYTFSIYSNDLKEHFGCEYHSRNLQNGFQEELLS